MESRDREPVVWSRSTRFLPWVAGLVCALSVGVWLWAGHLSARYDVRLVAPQAAVGGTTLPLRVLVFGELQRVEGPSLVPVLTRATLQQGPDQQLAHQVLTPGLGNTLEGVLQIPEGAAGVVELRIDVGDDADELAVSQRVALPLGLQFAQSEPVARGLPPLRRLIHGPPQLEGDPPPAGHGSSGEAAGGPLPLWLSVAGGACVPEQPCELFVASSNRAQHLSLKGSPAVELGARRFFKGPLRILRQEITVHGPEAAVQIQAVSVAERGWTRRVQLPVDLSALAWAPREPGAWVMANGAGGPCIVDGWQHGRWIGTGTLPDCGTVRVPFRVPSGLLRLQIRQDPFASQGAAVRVVPWGIADRAVAGQLWAAAEPPLTRRFPEAAVRLGDQLASGWSPAVAADRQLLQGFLLSQLEQGWLQVPLPTQVATPVARSWWQGRWGWAGLALGGLGLAALLGLIPIARGGVQGERALRALGQTAAGFGAASRSARRWRRILVLCAFGAVFLTLAVYILWRAGTFVQ